MTYGLPGEVAVFQDEALAFDTALPGPELERRVLASYPAAYADVLLSGWIRGPEAIARKAAAVALSYGKGKVVLLGFRAAAPRADARHLPVPVRRALLVDGEVVRPPKGGVHARRSPCLGPGGERHALAAPRRAGCRAPRSRRSHRPTPSRRPS